MREDEALVGTDPIDDDEPESPSMAALIADVRTEPGGDPRETLRRALGNVRPTDYDLGVSAVLLCRWTDDLFAWLSFAERKSVARALALADARAGGLRNKAVMAAMLEVATIEDLIDLAQLAIGQVHHKSWEMGVAYARPDGTADQNLEAAAEEARRDADRARSGTAEALSQAEAARKEAEKVKGELAGLKKLVESHDRALAAKDEDLDAAEARATQLEQDLVRARAALDDMVKEMELVKRDKGMSLFD